jgi:hypothetical protein
MDRAEYRPQREEVDFSLPLMFSLFLELDLNILKQLEELVFFPFYLAINTNYLYQNDTKLRFETIKKFQ